MVPCICHRAPYASDFTSEDKFTPSKFLTIFPSFKERQESQRHWLSGSSNPLQALVDRFWGNFYWNDVMPQHITTPSSIIPSKSKLLPTPQPEKRIKPTQTLSARPFRWWLCVGCTWGHTPRAAAQPRAPAWCSSSPCSTCRPRRRWCHGRSPKGRSPWKEAHVFSLPSYIVYGLKVKKQFLFKDFVCGFNGFVWVGLEVVERLTILFGVWVSQTETCASREWIWLNVSSCGLKKQQASLESNNCCSDRRTGETLVVNCLDEFTSQYSSQWTGFGTNSEVDHNSQPTKKSLAEAPPFHKNMFRSWLIYLYFQDHGDLRKWQIWSWFC